MEENLIHNIDSKMQTTVRKFPPALIAVLVIGAGVLAGFALTRVPAMNQGAGGAGGMVANAPKEMLGKKNTKLFPDAAEGIVKKGGMEGEGTHHLQRKGGESQNVYMTSSVVDLDSLVNKKIKVWGKTYSAQKAGWLMDVGYVEVQ